jgi:hypothetical protein
MLRHHAFILVTAGGLCAAAVTLCPGQAIAGSISPSSFNASIAIGETVKVVKKIATDAGPGLVDFLLLADNTGSMDGVINNVKSVANQLVTDLKTTYAGAQFAVARYLGDPSEPLENFSSAYQVIQKNTASEINTVAAINSWFANGGDDYPEASFYALQQGIQNGASTCPGLGSTLGFCGTSGQTVDWRPSARKVVLWFGDAPSQQTTVTMNNIKAILASENASLVALNSGPATTALDDTYGFGGQAGNQASSVTNTQDISLKVLGSVPTGLEVSFDCTDPLGCNDVIGGESRFITMAVKGLAAGDYNFSVIAPGVVGAIEQDRILVSDEDVSVPGPLPLLGVSAAFGWSRRLRRSMQKREALATTT